MRSSLENANCICFGSSPPRDASQPLGGSWSQALKGCCKVSPLRRGQTSPEPVALRDPPSGMSHRKEMQVQPWHRHSTALKTKRVEIKMLYAVYLLFSFWEVQSWHQLCRKTYLVGWRKYFKDVKAHKHPKKKHLTFTSPVPWTDILLIWDSQQETNSVVLFQAISFVSRPNKQWTISCLLSLMSSRTENVGKLPYLILWEYLLKGKRYLADIIHTIITLFS